MTCDTYPRLPSVHERVEAGKAAAEREARADAAFVTRTSPLYVRTQACVQHAKARRGG